MLPSKHPADPSDNGVNKILIRDTDVLLTFTEIKIATGDIDQSVYDVINLVRNTGTYDFHLYLYKINATELSDIARRK